MIVFLIVLLLVSKMCLYYLISNIHYIHKEKGM